MKARELKELGVDQLKEKPRIKTILSEKAKA